MWNVLCIQRSDGSRREKLLRKSFKRKKLFYCYLRASVREELSCGHVCGVCTVRCVLVCGLCVILYLWDCGRAHRGVSESLAFYRALRKAFQRHVQMRMGRWSQHSGQNVYGVPNESHLSCLEFRTHFRRFSVAVVLRQYSRTRLNAVDGWDVLDLIWYSGRCAACINRWWRILTFAHVTVMTTSTWKMI